MKNKTTSILLSIFYFIFCIFVIFHNASYRLDLLFSGKYLVFMLLSIVVFFVLMKVVKEIFDEDGNDF
jgi:ABC-type bacteriocin/lantibiotic exporter with double-glycine peptidase domain